MTSLRVPPALPAGPARTIAGAAEPAPAITAEQVTEALRMVFDPEFGLSVVELGLVYGIEVRGQAVAVTMTLTTPGCPIHDAMPDWVREAVLRIPGVERAEVVLTFDPPWTTERIAPTATTRRA